MNDNEIELNPSEQPQDVNADNPKEVLQSHDVDEAEIFLNNNGYTWPQVEALLEDKKLVRRLIRRVDLVLLPLLCFTFFLQFIDKLALSYGATFDLIESTHLVGNQYSWLSSIFYFGILVSEYPAGFLAQRFKVGRVISITVLCWATVLTCTAAASNFAGLAACRILLGVFEAPIIPCFMLLLGLWYPRRDQAFRAGLFYCCNGFGSMFGSLITYGIGQIKTFHVYKAVFLITGGVTLLWGCVLAYYLPRDVATAKRFTIEQKVMIMGIGRRNQTGVYNKYIKWYQVKEALLDIQVWLLFLFTLINELVNGGYQNFGTLIVKGIVTDPLKTIALNIPQGAFTVVFIASGPYIASRFKNVRTLVMAVYMIPAIIGTSLLWQLPRDNHTGLLIAYYIICGYVASLVIALQMPVSNLGGYTKRVVGTGIVFMGYIIGNIVGPQAFITSEAPVYLTGCRMMVACTSTQFGLALILRFVLARRNVKRDKAVQEAVPQDENDLLMDLTDFQNPHFRYQY